MATKAAAETSYISTFVETVFYELLFIAKALSQFGSLIVHCSGERSTLTLV